MAREHTRHLVQHPSMSDLGRRLICLACVGEDSLRRALTRIGEPGCCHYCDHDGIVVSLEHLAVELDRAFESHYRRTSPEPSDFEDAMMRHGIRDWDRDGEPIVQLICDTAQIEEEPAEEIRALLAARHGDRESAEMGMERPFDSESHYIEKEPDDREYHERWLDFENSIKTESRFFSDAARITLDSIFEVLDDSRFEGEPLIIKAGPETNLDTFYRARVFQSESKLMDALKRPDLQLSPPPAAKSRAGRMNAHGISVFYGATEAKVAVGEVRPPVGSRVLVGKFRLLRRIHLLDVRVLDSVYARGSVFDPDTILRQQKARFLTTLKRRITMPITPDDEPSEYLITQVVAEYLANRSDLNLDGILYPSVQGGADGENVMLFYRASRVEPYRIPDGTRIEAGIGHHYNDEDTEYFVSETVAHSAEESKARRQEDATRHESRSVTLALDAESLTVHDVTGIRCDTKPHEVIRRRW